MPRPPAETTLALAGLAQLIAVSLLITALGGVALALHGLATGHPAPVVLGGVIALTAGAIALVARTIVTAARASRAEPAAHGLQDSASSASLPGTGSPPP